MTNINLSLLIWEVEGLLLWQKLSLSIMVNHSIFVALQLKTMVNYIPILTTFFSAFFFIQIYKHYREKPDRKYIFWWMLGVLAFGLGTLTESINTLFDWNIVNFKLWYISGALLGGFPLAQGSVYLLMNKKFGDITAFIIVSIILIASVCIVLSPVELLENFDQRLTGSVFVWEWVRMFSLPINLYSVIFLVGGAIYSAISYWGEKKNKRFIGNIYIAIGAILPGIGGSYARMGQVEVLFVTEFLGLALIYTGYTLMKRDDTKSMYSSQTR